MKKFKFRLERVLHYRNLVKDEKRKELAKRNLELREAQEVLSRLEQEFAANGIEDGAIVTIHDLQLRGMYAERLKEEMVQQRLHILQCEERVEAALQEYLEAAKDSGALEKLRERKKEQYQEYVAKEEEKFLDELTTQKGNTVSK